MSANRNRRLGKEIQDVQKDTHSGITLELLDPAEMTSLKGIFKGPPDTPYEGGTFIVDIRIPNEYPFQPPKMKFDTKIWHPNVSSVTGAICLDTLGTAWSPILTLKSALISLQSLLASPEPKDPQDAEVARMLITDPEAFAEMAKQWAVKYADAPDNKSGSGVSPADNVKRQEERRKRQEEAERLAQYKGYSPVLVDRFTDMGFDVPTIVAAFDSVGIDRNNGQDYNLPETQVGHVTAKLFDEV
ncbi:hypothetical protein K461DRAFT_326115 [Myriangium duriaei CBS 260.36]|uniref:Ubiquitin-conjugating enzyme E2 1 n=1 Tax=Myriangium duriaei CBS 260.36 TaxID=1168546 RepID=A0A9P4MSY9_9PEZI|nr:hypothetical protein K461DRAFT_326115 [Myriangium duriaei CBS 260.36]